MLSGFHAIPASENFGHQLSSCCHESSFVVQIPIDCLDNGISSMSGLTEVDVAGYEHPIQITPDYRAIGELTAFRFYGDTLKGYNYVIWVYCDWVYLGDQRIGGFEHHWHGDTKFDYESFFPRDPYRKK